MGRNKNSNLGWSAEVGCSSPGRNSTARQAARLRLKALRDTSRIFLECQGLEDALAVLVDRLAHRFRGGCLLRGNPETGGAVPLAYAHVRRAAQDALHELLQTDPHAFVAGCCARAAQTGLPVFTPAVSSRLLHLWTQPAAWGYLDQFEVASLVVVPMGPAAGVVGTIAVWRERPEPPLTHSHCAYLVEVAQRVTLGLPCSPVETMPRPEPVRRSAARASVVAERESDTIMGRS